MPWISGNRYLSQSEKENNATIQTQLYRDYTTIAIADETIAAILGNEDLESTINPQLEEVGGGGGYGLVQWTPMSNLTNACSVLGLSPYTDGDVQSQVIIAEVLNTPSSIAQWYTSSAFISNYYSSGATSDMIGITGQQFLTNEMGWTADKLAIMFMAGYERPSYDPSVNHYDQRMQKAIDWFEFIGGVTPIERFVRPKIWQWLFP